MWVNLYALLQNHWRIGIEMDYLLKWWKHKKVWKPSQSCLFLMLFHFPFLSQNIFHFFFCSFSSVFRSLNINICLRVLLLVQSSCSFTVCGPAYSGMMFWSQGTSLQLPALYTMSYFGPKFKSNTAVPHWGSHSWYVLPAWIREQQFSNVAGLSKIEVILNH